MTDDAAATAATPAQLAGTVLAWSSVGAWQLWLSTGDDVPLYWPPHLVDWAAFTAVGVAVTALRSWPWAANPLWALATPLLFGLLGSTPSAPTGAAVYLLGLGVALWGLWGVARRWRLPAVVAILAMPWSLLSIDLLLEATPVIGPRLVGPLRRAPAPPPPGEGRSVVLISVDTLRWDRVGSMASVDRLKAQGAWWEKAMSTSSWTLPALASIHTGVPPAGHGALCLENGACQALYGSVSTLAERLQAGGWDTAAVAANPWTNASSGMTRGFRRFRDLAGHPPRRLLLSGYPMPTADHQGAEVVVDAALADVDTMNGGAFFLWVHFIDPHMPYRHAREGSSLAEAPSIRDSLPDQAILDVVTAAYDAEVEAVDHQLQRLLDGLETRGLLDDAVVIFTADHGEEFLDHGDLEHGHNHHTEVVDVPLVVVGPGVRPGQRSDLASLVDVAPTVLSLVGLPADGTDGYDLRSPVPEDRVAVAHGNLTARFDCSARGGDRRVIVEGCNLREPSGVFAYDLGADPWERHPLPVLDPDEPVAHAALSLQTPAEGVPASHPEAALRALGYTD